MSAPAWQLLASQPAWDITEIPRPSRPRPASAADAFGQAAADRDIRVQSLASACRWGTPAAFGWVRANAGGPVRVIAAGPGLTAGEDSAGPVIPLAFPAGARGRPLPPGGVADAFTVLPCWVPVAITTDALLTGDGFLPGNGDHAPASGNGPSLEEGLLRAWMGPFGWLVLAVPVTGERRGELTGEASLTQLTAQRHDSPRAQLATRRASVRHAELRAAATTGLWHVWLLAGAATPPAALRIAGLLTASLDLRGLPYGLSELTPGGPLPQLLGAPPGTAPGTTAARSAAAAAPGSLTRDVLAMHHTAQDYGPPPPAPDGACPGPAAAPRTMAANGLVPEFADPVPEFPCIASSPLLAALAVPPAREVPGVRLTLRPDFDVTPETGTPETGTADAGAVDLGVVLDGNRVPAGTLAVSRGSLNRHTFVCGATGSGKSQTVRHLLESATRAGIPWLVIEPAKAEYRLMATRLAEGLPGTEVITIRPGDPDVVPAGLNPLEPATGPGGGRFPLQAHADLVRALFLAAFQAEEPFPQVLAAALTRCYTEAGWDLINGTPAVDGAAYPTLADLQAAALAVVNDIGYGQEVRDNIRGFVSVRIGSLRTGTTGRFLDGGFPLDYGRLLSSNVVLEIEDCGDDTDKAFLTGAVLIRLTEHLRMKSRFPERSVATPLRHLTVVEEAHRLLRQPVPGAGAGAGAAAHAVEMFAGLLAEVRAYGEGLVIAEQIPSKLIPDVIKNTAVKIVHRLPAQDDRDTVGATMNLTPEQSAFLVTLVPGEAAVFADGMDAPVLARLPDGTDRELSGLASPASPASLVGRRSPACPADCAEAPCTLARMNAARNAASRDRRITLWAELSVAGHLSGWPMPMPSPGLTAALDGMERRLRDCALAQAVDTAVAARIPVMAARVPGPALAEHATTAMTVALDSNRWLCTWHEPEWNAPACVWRGILGELREYEREHPGGGPHPDTARWEELAGQVIPGDAVAEQAAIVAQWDADARGEAGVMRVVGLGNRSPSALEEAVGTTVTNPAWPRRLAAAITAFGECAWPLQQLMPEAPDEATAT
jgi:uncharacterized protein